MKQQGTDSRRIGRATYRASALAFALFLIYGSVVPLNVKSLSSAQLLRDLTAALNTPLEFHPDSDFLSNILLGVPLGYLILASLATDRRGALRRLAAAAATLPCAIPVSVIAEFLQLFSAGRTASIDDVFAQGVGAAAGIGAWLLIGEHVTVWLRGSLAEREAPALFNRILLAYCALFAVYQLMPLDL